MKSAYEFDPERYEVELASLIAELDASERLDRAEFERILRKHPKDGRGLFSKSDIIRGFRHLNRSLGWQREERPFLEKVRMKPVRTASGVAPVTVLTKPWPCPGKCIFCPSDVRMPKSYLSSEPGAQRAAQHHFDPYNQSLSRLLSYHNTGHQVDKVELIILGGTWSYYPEAYQLWFVKRCFEALNDFSDWSDRGPGAWPEPRGIDFKQLRERVDGLQAGKSYNRIVSEFVESNASESTMSERAEWRDLEEVQRANETAHARCVGLVLETRPDHFDPAEAQRMRRLGATKVQIGFQSLSDEVLRLNRRGHDVDATRRAMEILRQAGFKIHAHWMPNLFGSTPEKDILDYRKMFAEPAFRPDELKIYPCSLVKSAELMRVHAEGRWQPYDREELLEVLTQCLLLTPEYCRVTRVIRDIPGTDIVTGNKVTNFREIAEQSLVDRGAEIQEIRSREIRHRTVEPDELDLRRTDYETSIGQEVFLQYVTRENRIVGFLRLSLPTRPVFLEEIRDSAMVREVHIYGRVTGLGQRRGIHSQHQGLGARLIGEARRISGESGFTDLAVISSVGTKHYYRRLGFRDGRLYQHTDCSSTPPLPEGSDEAQRSGCRP